MLTQDQLEKLEPLTKHSKYGKLLSDAIDIWKQDDTIPIKGHFGVYVNTCGVYDWIYSHKKRCCLIGACLLNKTVEEDLINDPIIETMSNVYNISEDDMMCIWRGFDHSVYDTDKEAYLFGKQISEILNPENWYDVIYP